MQCRFVTTEFCQMPFKGCSGPGSLLGTVLGGVLLGTCPDLITDRGGGSWVEFRLGHRRNRCSSDSKLL